MSAKTDDLAAVRLLADTLQPFTAEDRDGSFAGPASGSAWSRLLFPAAPHPQKPALCDLRF